MVVVIMLYMLYKVTVIHLTSEFTSHPLTSQETYGLSIGIQEL